MPYHGTAVACIASAITNNGYGIAGVDWNARVLVKRTIGGDAGLAFRIRQASTENADVLNNSWRLNNPEGRYSHEVRLAFSEFYRDKRVAVASMGNRRHLDNVVQYPAAFGQGIVTVGATNREGDDTWFSSTGSHIDVAAPGDWVWTCGLDNSYLEDSGTSFAAPHASGLASLLLSVPKRLEPDDVEQVIRRSAEDMLPTEFDNFTGMGRINLKRALNLLQYPNELVHDAETGGTGLSIDWTGDMQFVDPPPGLPHTRLWERRYPVERRVTFPVTFQSPPTVWGRGSSTIGYSTDGSTTGWSNVNYGMGWCEPVGTIDRDGCTLRTYIYELVNAFGEHVAWAPTDAAHVVFAYTALGEAEVSDVGDEETGDALSKFWLGVQNPMRQGGEVRLNLPVEAKVRLEIFNVSGRRVDVIHDGTLTAGRHDFTWTVLRDGSSPLPAGLYFVRVDADGRRLTKKLVLVQ